MAQHTRIRTINFLPEVFQTETNRQFLSATLDQLVAQPNFDRREGYIGSRIGLGVSSTDYYVTEPDKTRADYQLEPAVTFLKENTDTAVDMLSYPGFIEAIKNAGGNVQQHQRLWQNEFYSWDPMVNLDPMVNFSQYYWLPYGPDAVTVSASTIYTRAIYTVKDQSTAYEISRFKTINPTVTMIRGGIYAFEVDSSSPFWIQGVVGTDAIVNNTNTRDVLGVTDNGAETGTVVFRVPEYDAQDKYYNLKDLGYTADLVSTLPYSAYITQAISNFSVTTVQTQATVTNYNPQTAAIQNGATLQGFDPATGDAIAENTKIYFYQNTDPDILGYVPVVPMNAGTGGNGVYYISTSQNVTVADARAVALSGISVRDIGGSIDGVSDIDGKTMIFYNTGETEYEGALYRIELSPNTRVPYDTGANDESLYDQQRIIRLRLVQPLEVDTRILINDSTTYAGRYFFRDSENQNLMALVPYLSARLDTLYYQSGDSETAYGTIKLIENPSSDFIDVERDILGKVRYVSPNGVLFTNGLKVVFDGNVVPSSYINNEYYVAGVGEAIKLVPVDELIAYEPYSETVYIPWDSRFEFSAAPWDVRLYVALYPDYITIARESNSRNPWSRSNRWFHIDVIEKTALYNGTDYGAKGIDLQAARAVRPILEFRPDLKLFESGSVSAGAVDFVDTTVTDAFTQVAGPTYMNVVGVSSNDNSLVLLDSINTRFTSGTPVQFTGTALGQRQLTIAQALTTVPAQVKFTAPVPATVESGTEVLLNFLKSPPAKVANIYNITRSTTAVVTVGNQLPENMISGDRIYISEVFAMNRIDSAPASYLPTINNNQYFDTTPYYVKLLGANSEDPALTDYELYFDYDAATGSFSNPVNTNYYTPYNLYTGGRTYAIYRGTWPQLNFDSFYLSFYLATGLVGAPLASGLGFTVDGDVTASIQVGKLISSAPQPDIDAQVTSVTYDMMSDTTTVTLASSLGVTVSFDVYVLDESGITAELYLAKSSQGKILPNTPLDATEFGEYITDSGRAGYGARGLEIGTQYYIDQILDSTHITVRDEAGNRLVIPESQRIIDYPVDAPATVSNTIPYSPDPNLLEPLDRGFDVVDGSRVIFANEQSPSIRNRIWVTRFITLAGARPTIVLEDAGEVPDNSETVAINGYTQQGKVWYYKSGEWHAGQSKDRRNQPPLFDIFDVNGYSFGDTDAYPSTTFQGCRLLSYGIGTGSNDPVLGFPLRYQSVDNIGDISYNVDLNVDTFTYQTNGRTVTVPVDSGYVHDFSDNVDYARLTGWVTAVAPSVQPQIFEFTLAAENTTQTFACDVPSSDELEVIWQTVQVFVNNKYLTRYPLDVEQIPANANYIYENVGNITRVTIQIPLAVGTPVQILVTSDLASETAYYRVPSNLESNPFNTNIETVSLGDVKGQYSSIVQNYKGIATIAGFVFGNNNFRDIGPVLNYGTRIIQNSAALALPGAFLREGDHNIFNALKFSAREYEKFKNLLVSTVDQGDYPNYSTAPQVLDYALNQIAQTRSSGSAFFWSDMIVNKSPYISNTYQINIARTNSIYALSRIYDYTQANYWGVAVYLTSIINNTEVTQQLLKDVDYVISADSPSITITRALQPGSSITVDEYNQTYGSFVPSTPTKLGIYPSFKPAVVYDTTYLVPTYMIQGHDGSLTKIYGEYINGLLTDIRDQVMLEFELRVYNNLKVQQPPPLLREAVWPGEFRTTDYQWSTLRNIYATTALNYFGQNRIDYTDQFYINTNPFTYNYGSAENRLSNTRVEQAYWRGIYIWLYDTATPNLTPWQMLGISDEPTWWVERYGPAPYTADNLLMWNDLAQGYVWNGSDAAAYVAAEFVRPELAECIPVDDCGGLVDPLLTIISDYDANKFQSRWVVGDVAPPEYSYMRSSSWPFDLQRLLILTKPAQWFNLNADLDHYRYSTEFKQYLYDLRYHLSPDMLEVYGTGTAKHSYINWLVDYQQQFGQPGTENITRLLNNLDVRLVYRMAGFSSTVLADFIIDKATANSTGALRIPDTDYDLLLYRDQPFDTIVYSAIIVQRTSRGWAVYGNSQTQAYFSVVTPRNDGQFIKIGAGDFSVSVTANYYSTEIKIPYGYTFATADQVCQFMVDYGRRLADQGVMFDSSEEGKSLDWLTAAQEFLLWSQTGWSVGSTANFNPAYNIFTVDRSDAIVEPLTAGSSNFILNQNLVPVQREGACVTRDGNRFTLAITNTKDTVGYTQLNVSTYEHAVVFKNYTSFGDLIYNLVTGLRQPRLYMEARVSAEWNGAVDAQGFIFNINNVPDWDQNSYYTRGSIVKFKNQYWVANDNVQPAAEFQNSQWVRSDYGKIATGILANPSTRAYESTLYYNTNRAALTNDIDLLGYSLIGFRPRDYLTLADFDTLSQVNIYKNFIGEKGTNAVAEAFKGANFKQGAVNYDIYEQWSILSGEYGGVSSENYVEAILDPAVLTGNPNTIEFVDAARTGSTRIQQTVEISDLWDYQQPIVGTAVMPVLTDTAFDRVLTAGYVSFNDVKYAAYNPLDFNLNSAVVSDTFKGNYLWVAKDRASWQVYTATSTGTAIVRAQNNYNGTSTITFAGRHGLSADAFISVSNFSANFDGFYQVQSVSSLTEIIVNTPNLDASVSSVTGLGVGLLLTSQRVADASAINSLDLLDSEFVNTLVWVDSYNQQGWAVLAKDINYQLTAQAQAAQPSQETAEPSEFGDSVAYSAQAGYWITDPLVGIGGTVYRYDSSLAQVLDTLDFDVPITKILAAQELLFVATAGRVIVHSLAEGVADTTIYGDNGDASFASNIAVSGDANYLYVFSSEAQQISVYQRGTGTDYQLLVSSEIRPGSQPGVANSQWGAVITVNYDGSLVFVSDAAARRDQFLAAGLVYVYARAVFSNNLLAYTLVQVLVGSLENSAAFGTATAVNTWASELIVGAPGTVVDVFSTQGVALRFTNVARRYGQVITGTFSAGETITGTIVINNIAVSVTAASPEAAAQAITAANIPNISVTVVDGDNLTQQIVIKLINTTTSPKDNLMNVLGAQASLAAWRIAVYAVAQQITEPHRQLNSGFGSAVAMFQDSVVISAPRASSYAATTFDFVNDRQDNDTVFDQNSTVFVDSFANTGAVYMFDYLPGALPSESEPGAFVYAQSVNTQTVTDLGRALLFNDYQVLATARSQLAGVSVGQVSLSVNHRQVTDWHAYRQSLAQVDINSLSGVNIFDRDTNTTAAYLDYIDPLQGKLLGAAQQNIDYMGTQDPAGYSVTATPDNNSQVVWGQDHVGLIWFDTSSVRYVDTHQPDLEYNAQYWGSAFPGSSPSVWVWTQQTVTPDLYTGAGQVLSVTDYSTGYTVDSQGALKTLYYYWVKNDGIVYTQRNKTLSSQAIASYVTNPLSSGISFMAPLTENAVALYNCQSAIQVDTPTLHIEWNTGLSSDQAHEQVLLIRDGVAEDFLSGFPSLTVTEPQGLYSKYISSLSGVQPTGFVLDTITVTNGGENYAAAPDVLIEPSPGDRTAPGSSDPTAARAVAQIANGSVINVVFTDLGSGYSQTPIVVFVGGGGGGARAYVNTQTAYQTVPDTSLTPPRRYGTAFSPNQTMFLDRSSAVENMATYSNRVMAQEPTAITRSATYLSKAGIAYVDGVRVNYDTTRYWQYVNWWVSGYNDSTKIAVEVDGIFGLDEANLYEGEVARVKYSSGANSEFFVYENGEFSRIGIENGTIEILSTLWTTASAVVEAYWITRAINEQIFTGTSLLERNQLLMLMFNYAQTEAMDSQNYLPWLNKTSFVDVVSKVRDLLPYTTYQADNSAFLRGYLNEVKPFHVVIKSFSYRYAGQDNYYGRISDFDLPAQYQRSKNLFVSPQLVYNTDNLNDYSYLPNAAIWQSTAYTDWYSAYGLSVATDSTDYVPVARLTNYITNISNSLTVDNAYGLPEYGVVLIDSEYIGYTGINRFNNTLTGLQRGAFESEQAAHFPGQTVLSRKNGVTVLDGARGYLYPPLITLSIDTQAYPQDTLDRIVQPEFTAQIINPGARGRLALVTVEAPGAGWPQQPRVTVEGSTIMSDFANTAVTLSSDQTQAVFYNTIQIPGNTFRSGDPVRITASEGNSLPLGLVSGEIYYLGKPVELAVDYASITDDSIDPASYVSLYLSRHAAEQDLGRIQFRSRGTGSDHLIQVTAVVSVSMSSQLVRQLRSRLKYDRVSYASIIQPWQANRAYIGNDQSGFLDKASSSEPSSLGQTTAPVPDRPGYYSNDFLASNSATTALNITSVVLSNPAVVITERAHNIQSGTVVVIMNVLGTTEVNGRPLYASVLSGNSIKLYTDVDLTQALDARAFAAYQGGGLLFTPVDSSFSVPQSLVLYNDQVWRCVISNTDNFFDVNKWQLVDSDDPELTALDRIAGWYKPTASLPAKAQQLVTGIEYPDPTYLGQSFTGDYRIDVNLRDQGGNTYYNVSGGEFTAGYAPEELVAGAVQDSLLFNVTTRPGAAWQQLDNSGAKVTGITVVDGGTGYSSGDVIRFSPLPAGSDVTAQVTAVAANGAVTAVALGDASRAFFGSNVTAQVTQGATAAVSLGIEGTVQSLTINFGGRNYSNAEITISPPVRGVAAQARVTEYVSGSITAIEITNPGMGYTAAPTVTVVDRLADNNIGPGRGAAVSAQLYTGVTVPADQVARITVLNAGQGYRTGDLITFNTPSITANTTAAVTLNNTVTVANNAGISTAMTVTGTDAATVVRVVSLPDATTVVLDTAVSVAIDTALTFTGEAAAATVIADTSGQVIDTFITNVGRGYSPMILPVATFTPNSTGTGVELAVNTDYEYYGFTGFGLTDVPVVLESVLNPQRRDTFSFAVRSLEPAWLGVFLRITDVLGVESSIRLYQDLDYTVNWVNKTATLTDAGWRRYTSVNGAEIQAQVAEVGGGNHLISTTSDITPFTLRTEGTSTYPLMVLPVPYADQTNPVAGATVPTNTFTARDISAPPANPLAGLRLFNRPWSAPLILEDGRALRYFSLDTVITVTNGGTGYNQFDPPQVSIPVPGQATGTAIVNPNDFGAGTITVSLLGGTIVGVTVTGTTSQYTNPPTIIITDIQGTGAVIRVNSLVNGGFNGTYPSATPATDRVTIVAAGANYSSPTVRALRGSISTVTLVRMGYGYSSLTPPAVRIVGNGRGAAAVAEVIPDGSFNSGSVLRLTLTSAGSGYTQATVSIDAPQFQGIPATAEAVVDNTGTVTAVRILNSGLGYYPVDHTPAGLTQDTAAPPIIIAAPADPRSTRATAEFANPQQYYSDYQLTEDESNPVLTWLEFADEFTARVSTHHYDITLLGAKYTGEAQSWSLPETQVFTVADPNRLNYALSNYAGGTNPENAVVEVNGYRLIPGRYTSSYQAVTNRDQVNYPAPVVLADVSTFHDSVFISYTDPETAEATDAIIMVGTNGTLVKTTQYPWTWTDRVTDTALSLNGLAYNDVDQVLVAVGDQGFITTSTDFGETWDRVWSITATPGTELPPTLYNITSVIWDNNDSQFLAVGDSGVYLRGTADGRTWLASVIDVFGWGGPEAATVVADFSSSGGAITAITFPVDPALVNGVRPDWQTRNHGRSYSYQPAITFVDPRNGYVDPATNTWVAFDTYSVAANVQAVLGTREYDARFSANIDNEFLSNIVGNAFVGDRAIAIGNSISGFHSANFTANIYTNDLEFTGSITGNVLTVSAVANGNVVEGTRVQGTADSVVLGYALGSELTVVSQTYGSMFTGNVTIEGAGILTNVISQQTFTASNAKITGNVLQLDAGNITGVVQANSTLYGTGFGSLLRIVSGSATTWQLDRSLPEFTADLLTDGNLDVRSISQFGELFVGAQISGNNVPAGTVITAQLTGDTGGIGIYTVDMVPAANVYDQLITVAEISNLTVTGVRDPATQPSGTVFVNGRANGPGVYDIDTTVASLATGQFKQGVLQGTVITALDTGTGGTGTYFVNIQQQTHANSLFNDVLPVMQVSAVSANTDFGAIKPGAALTVAGLPQGTVVLQQNLTGNIAGNRGFDGQYILSQLPSANVTITDGQVLASYRDEVAPNTLLLEEITANSQWRIGTTRFVGSISDTTLTISEIVLGQAVSLDSIVSVSGNLTGSNTRIVSQHSFTAQDCSISGNVLSWTGAVTGTPEVGMRVTGLNLGSGTTITDVSGANSVTLDANRGISFTGYVVENTFSAVTNESTLVVTQVSEGYVGVGFTVVGEFANGDQITTQILAAQPGAFGGVGNYTVTGSMSVGSASTQLTFAPQPFEVSGLAGVLNGAGVYELSDNSLGDHAANTTMFLSLEQSITANTSILLAQRDYEFMTITDFTVVSGGQGYSKNTRLVVTPDVRDGFTIPPTVAIEVEGRGLGELVIVRSGQDYDVTANVQSTVETPVVYTVTDYTTGSGNGVGAVFTIAVMNGSYELAAGAPVANLGVDGIYFGGADFDLNDTITISGALLGGADSVNDLTMTVDNVTADSNNFVGGRILELGNISGTAVMGGNRAAITATITDGGVTAVAISSAGTGYTYLPSLTVSGANNQATGTQINTGWDADIWDRANPELTSIASDGNTVAVVSTTGQAFYSDAGTDFTWLEAPTQVIDRLNRVRFEASAPNANSQWISVGDNGTVLVSSNAESWLDVSTTVANRTITLIELENDTVPAVITLDSVANLANGDSVYMFGIAPEETEYFNVTGAVTALNARRFYVDNIDTGNNTAELYSDVLLSQGVTLQTLGYSFQQNIASIQGNGTAATLVFDSRPDFVPFYIGQKVYIQNTLVLAYNGGPYPVIGYYNDDPRSGVILADITETDFSTEGLVKVNYTITPQANAILNGGAVVTTTEPLYDVRFAESTFAAVGANGTVITNSGAALPSAWTTETTDTTRNLYTLIYADNTEPTVHPDWFMGGDFGSIWRTDDYAGTGLWSLLDTHEFDITRMHVYVNGVELVYNTDWQVNFFPPYYQAAWSGEYAGVRGIYSGTPWDGTRMQVVLRAFNAATGAFDNSALPIPGGIIRITYDSTSPSYVISNQNLFLRVPVNTADTVAVTTYHDTVEQSLDTVYVSGVTVSAIADLDTYTDPVTLRTPNEHNLVSGQAVRIEGIDGGAVRSRLNGGIFYVNVINANVVELFRDSARTTPVIGIDAGPWLSGGYIWPLASYNLGQTDWTLDDLQRLWVTVNGRRIWSDQLKLYANNELAILVPIAREDDVVVTSMTPRSTPDELSFTIRVAETPDSVSNLSVQSVDVNNLAAIGQISSTGWTTAPTVFFSAPDVAGGRLATARALLGYGLASVPVLLPGSGYTNPVVTVSAPEYSSGTAAVISAVVDNGTIVALSILQAGSGYTATQTITVTITDSTGSGAVTGAAVLESTGSISAVEVTDGGWGYLRTPALRAIYDGTETVPEFRVNVVDQGSIFGDVYNANPTFRTWLVEPIEYTSTTIYVDDVSRILDIVETTELAQQEGVAGRIYAPLDQQRDYQELTYIQVKVNGTVASSTTYFVDQSGLDQSGSFSSQQNPGSGGVKLVFTSGAAVDDQIEITLGFGNRVRILSEIVQFESVDLENNLLLDVRRGVDKSTIMPSVPTNTLVQSIGRWNKLPDYYYTSDWRDSRGGPLQTSDSAAALFLRQ